jgi:hypothetical protein
MHEYSTVWLSRSMSWYEERPDVKNAYLSQSGLRLWCVLLKESVPDTTSSEKSELSMRDIHTGTKFCIYAQGKWDMRAFTRV